MFIITTTINMIFSINIFVVHILISKSSQLDNLQCLLYTGQIFCVLCVCKLNFPEWTMKVENALNN